MPNALPYSLIKKCELNIKNIALKINLKFLNFFILMI
jgi:hypothetical protein